jgi:hypothetical protein
LRDERKKGAKMMKDEKDRRIWFLKRMEEGRSMRGDDKRKGVLDGRKGELEAERKGMQDWRWERNGTVPVCRAEGEIGMERDARLKEREKWKGMKEGRRRGLEEDEGLSERRTRRGWRME